MTPTHPNKAQPPEAWRILLVAVWLAVVVAVFGFGPPSHPDTPVWIWKMITGQWEGLEGWMVSIFNQLGIWPMVMASVLWAEQRSQRVPYWPFGLLSMATGMYSLTLYLVVRDPAAPLQSTRVARWLDSPLWVVPLLCAAVGLMGYGLATGDPYAYAERFKTEQLVCAMSVDWLVFWLASGPLMWQDAKRRGWSHTNATLPLALLLPLVGPLIYLLLRPRLAPNAEA
ncbi:MAG: hypothetical protein AAFS10_05835 [Myxococcota bacterium]